MSIKKISFVISFFIILKALVWLFIVPVFQAPDEAGHFAYVQYLAEEGKKAHPRRGSIVSSELVTAAKILNFNWGKSHPVWQGYPAGWEEKIKKIEPEKRRQYVPFEQRTIKNPPFYYWLATTAYRLTYPHSFLCRFYAVRFFSFLLFTAVVFFTYKIGRLLFTTQKEALTLMSLVAFQPMFSFIGVSVNNDILAILIGTLFIYFGLKAMKFKKKNDIFIPLILILIGLLVKPILIVLLLAFPFILGKKIIKGLFFSLGIMVLIFITSLLLLQDLNKPTLPAFDFFRYQIAFADYQAQLFFLFNNLANGKIFFQFWQYLIANKDTFLQNLFPWYWGVFGWLEATMPLWVYRILKIICGLAFIGLIRGLIDKKNKDKGKIWFLILTILIFSLGIIFNDFKTYVIEGEAFGIQGRYFLPVISAQMTLLFMGLKTLILKKIENYLFFLLIIGSISLNVIGFFTMYRYFYG